MAESDFSTSCIIGYGLLLSFAVPLRPWDDGEDLPGPGAVRTYVPGFFDTTGLRIPSP